MALDNIEYGSIASSEIMNKNFSYLDNKIAETNVSIIIVILKAFLGIVLNIFKKVFNINAITAALIPKNAF